MTTDDEQTITALRSAMETQVRDRHLDPAITSAAVAHLSSRAARNRHRLREYLAVAAACVVVAGAAVTVYVVRGPDTQAGPPSDGTASACADAVVTSTLPEWARYGFGPDAFVQPHITGASGDIIGVLFADPLRSPPQPGTNNKILWVARAGGAGPLVIRAHLDGSAQTATRTVPTLGPSIIDLPAPGCWQLTLTWGDRTDTAALPYSP